MDSDPDADATAAAAAWCGYMFASWTMINLLNLFFFLKYTNLKEDD